MNPSPKSFFTDGDPVNPQFSMHRLLVLLVTASVVVLPMIAWFELSMLKGELQKIPENLVGFVAAAGAFAGAVFVFSKRSDNGQ